MVPAKAGKPVGPNETLGFFIDSKRASGYRAPGSGPNGSGVCRVGAPVWPNGVTVSAEAAFTVAAAAAAAVVAKNLRLSIFYLPTAVLPNSVSNSQDLVRMWQP